MKKESVYLELSAITPRIIELERKGKTAYTCTECAELWKKSRRLTYLLKQLTLQENLNEKITLTPDQMGLG